MVTPLKMNYSGKKSMPGVQSGAAPKIMKGAREAGAMYKKPGTISQQGKNAKDMSSGQSNPVKGSPRDKIKYTQAKQPVAFSNADNGGMKMTKFVC